MSTMTKLRIGGVVLGLIFSACGAEPISTPADGDAPKPTPGIATTATAETDTTASTNGHAATTSTGPNLISGGPVFSEAPPAVATREPLFYCGAEALDERVDDANPYPHIELRNDAGACYRERAAAGQPSEMITIGYTLEGDPFLTIRRLLPDGSEVFFWDATQDNYGPGAWVMTECERYSGAGPSDELCDFDIEITDG